MPDKLIIHLGDCKSGSTSIQTILYRKAWTSQSHTIVYPDGFNHLKLAKCLYQQNLFKSQSKFYNKIRRSLITSDASTAILSGEAFEVVDPQLLSNAIDTYFPEFKDNFQLISYFRPHAARLLASYSERVKKGGFQGSLEEFVDLFETRSVLSYAPRVKQWRKVFGDRYHLKPMIPSELEGNDVVHDFFSFALGDNDFKFTEPTRYNESVSLQDLSAFIYFHKKFQSFDVRNELLDERKRLGSHLSMIMADIPHPNPTKLQLDKRLAQRIVDLYIDDAKKMDERYFDGIPMESALHSSLEKALDTPQSLDVHDHCSPETVRMLDCWLELSQRMMKINPSVFYMLTRRPGR